MTLLLPKIVPPNSEGNYGLWDEESRLQITGVRGVGVKGIGESGR